MIPYLILLLVLYNRLTIVLKITLAYLQNEYISLKFNATVNLILTLIRFIVTIIEYYGAVTPEIRQAGNRLSGLPETNYYASLLA